MIPMEVLDENVLNFAKPYFVVAMFQSSPALLR
jgi:hypothetical protein